MSQKCHFVREIADFSRFFHFFSIYSYPALPVAEADRIWYTFHMEILAQICVIFI